LAQREGQEDDAQRKLCKQTRDRLLTRIPYELLTSVESRSIVDEIRKGEVLPQNEPPVKFHSYSHAFTEKDWLVEQGANLSTDPNKKLFSYFDPLDKFAGEWRNKTPTTEAIASIFPIFLEAFEVIHTSHGAEPPLENGLWTKLGSCAQTMARSALIPGDQHYIKCRQVLLECSRHPEPKPNPEYDSKYDSPSWSPFPRIEAAQGLPWLASRSQNDNEVIDAIEQLIRDKVPPVRFLTTLELWRISGNYAEQFWKMADLIAEAEINKVVQGALCESLGHLVWTNEAKVTRILDRITRRTFNHGYKIELLESALHLVMWLLLVRNNGWARMIGDRILANPGCYPKTLSGATLDALAQITPENLGNNEAKAYAERAREWVSRAIDSAGMELVTFGKLSAEQITEEARSDIRNIYSVIDEVIRRIYFAAGLFENSQKPAITDEERKAFYFFVEPLLKQVIGVSDIEKGGLFFASTAHQFMELLNGMLPYDPPGVLHLASAVARIGRSGGYSFDSLAVREVVQLVQSVLANHRLDVRDAQALDDLLNLLDIFTDVGWPEALQMVWRLDEIFR
jgi:hypothetical protein